MSATAVFQQGATALITGAASGIGLAIAKLCHGKGMKLLLADRNAEALDAAKQSFSGDVVTSTMDVSNPADWKQLKDLATQKYGTIELLVLNAGAGSRGTWGDDEYFRKVRIPLL